MEAILNICLWIIPCFFVYLAMSLLIRLFYFLSFGTIKIPKLLRRITLNGIVSTLLIFVCMYTVFVTNVYIRKQVDYPKRLEAKDMIGEWHKGKRIFILNEDGTANGWFCEKGEAIYSWSLKGNNLIINKGEESLFEYEIITFFGKFRILDESELVVSSYKKKVALRKNHL